MKKLIVFLSLLVIPFFNAKADVDYDIKHYYINASIKENGDMFVQEALFIKGSFNGYERDINYGGSTDLLYDATDLQNIKVQGKMTNDASFDIFNDASLKDFEKVNYANIGEYGKYTLNKSSYGYEITMYNPADYEMEVFLISYTVKDAVILHNDVAELNWNFIGWGYEDDISDLQIKVYLPQSDTSNNFRIWAASNSTLAGEVEKIASNGLWAYTKKLNANDPLTVRTTFSKELLNSSLVNKKSNHDALENILEEEQKKADEANALRATIKRKYWTSVILAAIFDVSIILAWLYIYFKYDKEYKPVFNMKYNREFIDEYNVEVVDYLMHKDITSNALSASIMNLIYKKNIKLNEIPDLKKKEYDFELVNRDNLNDSENKLVDFLFNKVGSNNHFTTKELKTYASGTKTCTEFLNTYTAWKQSVITDGESQEFFEKKNMVIPIVFLIISILVFSISCINEVISIFCYTPLILGIALVVYSAIYTKKTKKGIEHYSKWQAFKNFLNDFGTFEIKELPEIALWDRYLVYATIFGLADKVEKAMNVKIKEISVADTMYNSVFIYNNINIGPTINSSFNEAVSSAHTAVNRANASSSMSSGSGFGGGFSSGGGFGGGGGGGHGF